MLIIWLEFPEISLKFEQFIQKLFDFNQVKIVMIKAVCYMSEGMPVFSSFNHSVYDNTIDALFKSKFFFCIRYLNFY